MDLGTLAAIIIIAAFAFYALERVPFPANPAWLKKGVEALVAIIFCIVVLQRIGIDVIPHR